MLSASASDGESREIAITWEPTARDRDLQYVHWEDELEPGTQLVFAFDVPGEDVRLPKDGVDYPVERRLVELTVTESAPLPASLGVIWPIATAFGVFPILSSDGDCAHLVQSSYVDIQLTPGIDAWPWMDALYVETRVDDQPVMPYRTSGSESGFEKLGGSVLGPDRDRVFVVCALPRHVQQDFEEVRAATLAPGRHDIRMVGYLPDGSEYTSETRDFVLECPKELPDAGINRYFSEPDPSLPWDAGGARLGTAGVPEHMAADGGDCAAVAVGSRSHGVGAYTAIMLLGWLARCRSRRRRHASVLGRKLGEVSVDLGQHRVGELR
ncbi:MAG: hypothetical protein ABW321_14925 [Polyangiales bacterium]